MGGRLVVSKLIVNTGGSASGNDNKVNNGELAVTIGTSILVK